MSVPGDGSRSSPVRPAFSLRGLEVRPPLLLAPMADLTGAAFRGVVRGYGGCGLFCSEMLNIRRVPTEPDRSPIFKGFGQEPDLVLQVLGDDPDLLGRAVARLERFAPAGYDWNLGCTRAKITRWGWGADLLNDPPRLARGLAALRRATQRPVTVKMRLPDAGEEAGVRALVAVLESEGADAITVHPRTSERRFRRPARWDVIAAVKSWVKVPVIGNGDVAGVEDALRMFAVTGCDGVMIGRAAAARPYLFRDIAARLRGEEPPPPPGPDEVLERLLAQFGAEVAEPKRARELRTFCQYFAEGLPVPHWFWGPLQALREGPALAAAARAFFSGPGSAAQRPLEPSSERQMRK
jgi:tRNA-dihydrouridine synthase B